jgi:hypothetical protein
MHGKTLIAVTTTEDEQEGVAVPDQRSVPAGVSMCGTHEGDMQKSKIISLSGLVGEAMKALEWSVEAC